jgi:hypothetical protein
MRTASKLIPLAAALGLLAVPAGSLASGAISLNISAPLTALRGSPISLQVNSAFSNGANGSRDLSLWLQPPSDGACPSGVRAPHNADILLTREPADQVLQVDAQSSPLNKSGSWNVCGYLTHSGSISARAHHRVTVTGR